MLGDNHFETIAPEEKNQLVEEAKTIDSIVSTAVAEHSLNPQSMEASIKTGILPNLFKLMGLEKPKTSLSILFRSPECVYPMENNRIKMQILTYGEGKIPYQICHVTECEGKVAIHVHPDGSVQVDAPMNTDLSDIKIAVQKRARWIVGHIEKAQELREYVLPREYVSGESYYYQGVVFN